MESLKAHGIECDCRQNRVIEYSKVAKLGIPSARAHLAAAFPDGVPLETVFVGPELLQQADAAAEEAVASGTWCAPLPQLSHIMHRQWGVILLTSSLKTCNP